MAARRITFSAEQALTRILDSSDCESSDLGNESIDDDPLYSANESVPSSSDDDIEDHDEPEDLGLGMPEDLSTTVSEDLGMPEDLSTTVSEDLGMPEDLSTTVSEDLDMVVDNTAALQVPEDLGMPEDLSTTVSEDLDIVVDNTADAYDAMDDLPLPPPPPVIPMYESDFPLPPPPLAYTLEDLDLDTPLPPPPPPSDLMFPDETQEPTIPTPVKTPSRKRKRDVSTWKRNLKSARHNSGLTKWYGGVELSRQLKPPCTNCMQNCTLLFTEDVRLTIFRTFWGMNSKNRRRNFIVSHVHSKKVARSRGEGKTRSQTLSYTLPFGDGSAIKVCKTIFLNTLDVSDRIVLYNLKNANFDMVEPKPHPPAHNAISNERICEIEDHIESFPKVESHYCRADTKREYLEASLTMRQMYRLYSASQTEKGRDTVSEYKYRQVFCERYNLSFHQPSKDTCDTCTKYSLKPSPTVQEQHEQECHLRRKMQARENKEFDKKDVTCVSAAFDLQQVITCPKISVASAYYLRKLNIYNFTILNLRTLQGTCYTWNEKECNRGTNDIASCVWKWLRDRENEGVKRVIFYSDCCGGQNRNRLMITALLKFLSCSTNIECIEQKFFETGHSKNECDSMHSVIQRQYTKCDVFLPSGFYDHMKKAQHKQPYIVNMLTHKDVMDFNSLNLSFMNKAAFSGIQKMHHIVYTKEIGCVSVSLSEEIGGQACKKLFLKRGKTQKAFRCAEISKAYDQPCGIDMQKKADLLKLADFLPEDCRPFYVSL